ncbi:MAG: aminotransferase class I/II-fold pyridoxal phosphate-dependent enzyme, partial [Acidobacteria bacterium]|nr:aminotransferase class I/II-fold pyridoxal phosphate-dependent enzyme [Acidobacteriota bacterium]
MTSKRIPLVKPSTPSSARVQRAMGSMMTSGQLTKGPWLEELEERAAQQLGVRHAVAVSSCTTGLMLTHKCLELSGEVIVPSFTFMATVSALVWAGLTPVFAESDPATKNIDPSSIADKISSRTSAIVAIHNFGNPAAIVELSRIAERAGLSLIFDAAHAFGTRYNGQAVGGQGAAQVFSMSPTKLVVAGEGGIVATNDDSLAGRLRLAREYGNDGKYNTVLLGMNGRMPEPAAMLGSESILLLDKAVSNRNKYAAYYRERLGELSGISFQLIREQDICSYKDFCITVDANEFGVTRDELAAALLRSEIDTRAYYDPPAHLQSAFLPFVSGPLPATERLSKECLSLPMWSVMDESVLDRICDAIEAVHLGREIPPQPPASFFSERLDSGLNGHGRVEDARIQALLRSTNGHAKNADSSRHVDLEHGDEVFRLVKDKVVMVTGAGGSIGAELARQLSYYPLRKLILVERSEHTAFLIDRELAERPAAARRTIVADICDADRMRKVFAEEQPQVVFHAAAHKHVALMETNVAEASKNNILGTHTIAQIAGEQGVKTFVLISTDKAVRPASIMGATKRVAELVVQNLNSKFDTAFLAVRFGNVIGSRGSVTTIWEEQIKRGGPVTVTHPGMERYFMT